MAPILLTKNGPKEKFYGQKNKNHDGSFGNINAIIKKMEDICANFNINIDSIQYTKGDFGRNTVWQKY